MPDKSSASSQGNSNNNFWLIWLLAGLAVFFILLIILLRGLCTDVWYVKILGLPSSCGSSTSSGVSNSDQRLTLSGSKLAISNGNSIDLASVIGAKISTSLSGADLTIVNVDGAGQTLSTSTVNLSSLIQPGANGVNGSNGTPGATGPQGPAGPAGAGSGTVTNVATDATLQGGPITTTGVLGLNLANPNNWTGLQTFTGGVNIPGATTLNSLTVNGTTNLNGIANIGDGGDCVAINSNTWDVNCAGDINTPGNITTQDITVNGNTILGNSAADTITFNGTGASDLDMGNFLITNIGAAGTDFTAGGGLTLAGPLVTNSTVTNNGLVTNNGNVVDNGDLTVNGTTALNGIANIGDGGDCVAVNSNTWDISCAGVATGLTGLTTTGSVDLTGATLAGATPLVFDGATPGGFTTSFAFVDPTANNTITFPDASGSVVLNTTMCTASVGIFCQNGNSFGTTAVLGTNDAQNLAIQTNGLASVLIDTNGNVINSRTAAVVAGTLPTFDATSYANNIGGALTGGSTASFINSSFGNNLSILSSAGNITFDNSFSNIGWLNNTFPASTYTNFSLNLGYFADSNMLNVQGLVGQHTQATITNSGNIIGLSSQSTITNSQGLLVQVFTGTLNSVNDSVVFLSGGSVSNTSNSVVSGLGVNVDNTTQSVVVGNSIQGSFNGTVVLGSNNTSNPTGIVTSSAVIGTNNTLTAPAGFFTSSMILGNNNSTNTAASSIVAGAGNTFDNANGLAMFGAGNNTTDLTGSLVLGSGLTLDGSGGGDPTLNGAILAGNGAVDARISYVGNNSWLNVAGGNVGVGTNTPGFKLDVANSLVGYTAAVTNTNDAAGSNGMQITAGENAFTTGSDLITFKRPDGTIIGSVNQDSSTTVAFNITSDERLKENIANTHYNLDTVLSLGIKDYNYISDSNKTQVTGLLAQELYKLFPGAVTVGTDEVDANGNLTHPWQVDYSKLSPLALKGIQDLNAKLESAVLDQNGKLDAVNTQLATQGITVTSLGDDMAKLTKRVDAVEESNVERDARIKALEDELRNIKSGSTTNPTTNP